MRRLNFKTLSLLVLFSTTLIIVSCNKDKDDVSKHDPQKAVTVASFEPKEGRVRDYVLIKGSNFGSDKSAIKVFFNDTEAEILGVGATDGVPTILVLVNRIPLPNGDGEAEVFVQVGDKPKAKAPGLFSYKVSASVITLAGNGTNRNEYGTGKLSDLLLSGPTYIGVDYDYNIYCGVGDTPAGSSGLLLISEEQNSVKVVAHVDQGYNHRGVPNLHPLTGQMMLGGESDRDRHIFINPNDDFTMEVKFIKQWDDNGFPMPQFYNYNSHPINYGHYNIVYCEWDGYLYTRYTSGQIVKINPEDWTATIIGMTPQGVVYGMGFNTYTDRDENGNRINIFTETDMRWELWMAYSTDGGTGGGQAAGAFQHRLITVDIRDNLRWSEKYDLETYPAPGGLEDVMSSLQIRLDNGAGHRDGPISVAQINNPRQLSFDANGVFYLGDRGTHTIRKVDTTTDPIMVSTLIGIPGISGAKDGAKEDATFNAPHGIVSNREGNILYVADNANHRIRRIAVE
ncbi:MAG: IPT/TIG domain-containing protein [Bacteroidales bacterium]|jgi:hypothetical protein|nr:IPT/TIG domain-containing protein [Bacteroidales bacterium]